MQRTIARLAALAVVPLAVAACSASSSSTSATTTAPPTTAAASGSINVLAAASLTGVFTAAKPAFGSEAPGVSVTYDFAGSNALVTQIEQGGAADVFASADTKNMDKLVTAGLVDTPVTFARNTLEIAVAPGNPKKITGLSDLARTDVSVVLEAQGVPAGDYSRQILTKAGVTVTPKSLEADVKSAITKVTSGEADATIVYVTDVKAAGAKVDGVTIPADQNTIAVYPIAVIKATAHQAAAQAFVTSAVSGAIQKELVAEGFLPPQ